MSGDPSSFAGGFGGQELDYPCDPPWDSVVAYALAASRTNAYVYFDAYTLCYGILQAIAAKRGADADQRGHLPRCPFLPSRRAS
jgi:hypothetical protein